MVGEKRKEPEVELTKEGRLVEEAVIITSIIETVVLKAEVKLLTFTGGLQT